LPEEYWELAAAHEGFHIWQYGAPELPEGWVESQPGYDKMRAALVARGYQDDPAAIAREWATYAATDDLERFGFTKEEGRSFLGRYFSKIIEQGGIDALDRVGNNISPDAQSIIETKRREYARNHSQAQQEAPTEGRGSGSSIGSETIEINTGRDSARDRISLQGGPGNGRERGSRGPDAAEVERDQPAGLTETVKTVEAHGLKSVNLASNSTQKSGFKTETNFEGREAIDRSALSLPFIKEALAAGAKLNHVSFQYHGSNWTIVSFANAKGTYLLKGDDVYVTHASVREGQAAIDADPVALHGIKLQLAGDIEIRVSEVRSTENRIESRGRVTEHSLGM
jgi:hypothetical protein